MRYHSNYFQYLSSGLPFSIIFGSLLLSAIFTSCKNAPVGNEVIGLERTKMVSILTDMYVADSAISNVAAEQRDSVRKVFRYYIERIHKMPIERIDSLVSNLSNYPSLNKEIQKEVVDSLKVIEARKKYGVE